MNRYMLLHFGFEPPTEDIMVRWTQWFDAVAERAVEHGGFTAGREITRDGTRDLPMGPDSITGYSIIEAESLDEAERLARDNPFIASIRIYPLRTT